MTTLPEKMTRAGVGPTWVLVSLACSLPFVLARIRWPGAVHVPLVSRTWVVAVAAALLALGVPLCLAAIVRLARGFPKGELFTSGPYALCRHPIYASWIVFNVPAIVLLADNWLGLLSVVPMYVALRILVRREEAWLERTFGDRYLEYRRRVNPVLPVPRFWVRARR